MKKRYRVEFDRRQFLFVGGVASVAPFVVGWTKPNRVAVGTPNTMMKPGDYVWDPGRSPAGEVVIIVSIPEQIVHVYRGGIEIGKATCSTGRKGHATPTGVFVVLEKDINHVSSLYKGAKMPFMERLTWRGVALHAGNLPGYPASHGCIRMPYDFAQLLFGVSHLGVAVIVANDYSEPADVVHPTTFLPRAAAEEASRVVAKAQSKSLPPKRRHLGRQRPAKVVVSIPDKSVTVLEDGKIVAEGPLYVKGPGESVGSHVFVLKGADRNGAALRWTATSFRHSAAEPSDLTSADAVIARLSTDDRTANELHRLMHPGLTMLITDRPAASSTRSERGFVIATHHDPEGWETTVFEQ